uniref:CheY-like response regulator n=1 Tax=uncultured bacterium A1Q1_fos_1093 TaxID=1256542 RepID=L7VT66_9BACT|nr:CheY-like response regulator [uncultured bacterium A1Q1_fos_1093]
MSYIVDRNIPYIWMTKTSDYVKYTYFMLPGLTCLLIDDDIDDQEIFLMALQDINLPVECVVANDGFHALEILHQDTMFVPDYIFIDLNMPRMNGKQCVKEIKKIEHISHVPVVMYSTSSSQNDVEESKKLGADYFITKPTSIYTLTKTLSEFFVGSKKRHR